jgi:hypothetical protein
MGINTIYLILMTMLDEINKYLMEETLDAIAEKKKEWIEDAERASRKNGYCVDPNRRSQGGSGVAMDSFINLKYKYSTGQCIGVSGSIEEVGGNEYDDDGDCSNIAGTWVNPKDRCEEAGYNWMSGTSWEALGVNCAPWEQIFMVIVSQVFGDEGIFSHLKGFVERIKNGMKIKARARGSELDDIAASSTSYLKNAAKYLRGAIDIVDWLLALNAEAFDLCNMMTPGQSIKPGDLDDYELINCQLPDGTIEEMTRIACSDAGGTEVALIQCQLPDGTVQEMTPGACESAGGIIIADPQDTSEIIIGGDTDGTSEGALPSDSGTGNLGKSGGARSTYSTSGKLDITGLDTIGIMVFQDPSAVAAFLSKGIGLSAQEASEAVAGANKGECVKNLTKEELQSLNMIMNQAGVEV